MSQGAFPIRVQLCLARYSGFARAKWEYRVGKHEIIRRADPRAQEFLVC